MYYECKCCGKMVDDGDIQNKICFFCMEKQFKEEQEKIQADNHLNDLLSMMENASKEELIKSDWQRIQY